MSDRSLRLLLLTARELLHGFLRRNTRWLGLVSIVVVPLLLVAAMLAALLLWPSDSVPAPQPLRFAALAFVPDDGRIEPAAARQALQHVAPVTELHTHLSEAPIWFEFTPPPLARDAAGPPLVYFPSRHARMLSCWYGAALAPLGTATRSGTSGALVMAKSGFATVDIDLSGEPVLCRGVFVGPARLSVSAWQATDFDRSTRAFAADAGLLEGGLTIFAVFMVLVALINREPAFLVFAAWLVVNARLGAISAGWDTVWLGHQIPEVWLEGLRKFITASNFPLTVFLFSRLFRDDLETVGNRLLQKTLELIYLPMYAAALLLPYRLYIPMLWLGTAVGYGIVVYFLARILLVTRSRIALWFAASLVVTAVAGYAEVIMASFGAHGPLPYFNSVTAALCSALLVAMALAEQMRTERFARREAELALRKTYEQVPVAFFTADTTGRILRGNPALGRLLGLRALEGGARWQDYFEGGAWQSLQAMLGGRPRARMRFQSLDLGAWYEVRASLGDDLVEGTIEDITEAVSANRKLIYLADHDQLTGTLSRRAIEQALRGAIQSAGHETPAALAYMDLDRFKTINDLFGHTAGDEVLRQACGRVAGAIGGNDLLGRIGGDEFLILLRGATLAEATAKCRELVDLTVGSAFRVHDLAFRIGVSFGVVEVTPDVEVVDMIAAADRACRQAKAVAAANHVVAIGANAPDFHQHEEERRMVGCLTPERAPDFLSLAMQPIMSVSDPYGSLDFEVLLRPRGIDCPVMSPERLIRVAEAHGRVGVVDRWVVSTTLEWLDANLAQLGSTRFVTVNLAGASVNDEKVMTDAYAMLRAHPRAARHLCIEITEGVALRDFDQTRRVLERLREFDVKLALDDFGTGYTSFTYLSDLRADVIKIDRPIVASAARHPSRMSIVQAIADLARNLGMRSIAEGVEDAGTLRAMAEVGIDYIQGYGIARPMPPAEILLGPHAAHWIEDSTIKAVMADIQANRVVIDDGPGFGSIRNLH